MKISPLARKSPRIEMIPLIDTFFLVLAFFISAVLSMELVRGLPVELPRAGAATPVPRENRLILTLKADGRLEMEGQPVTLKGLPDLLRQEAAARPSLQVGIRADRLTPYERVVELLGAVKAAGVSRVALLSEPAEGEPSGPRLSP